MQWLSGRVLDPRPRGGRFEPYRSHCVVSLSNYMYKQYIDVSNLTFFYAFSLDMCHNSANKGVRPLLFIRGTLM